MRAKLTLASVAVGLILAAACGGGPPPPPPGPDPDSLAEAQRIRDSIAEAQRRADSIARERQRLEEERVRIEREREEAARREAEALAARVRDMLSTVVNFDFDRSNIRAGRDTEVLEMKLRILQANPALRIQITGHCDERGSDEYNMALGNRRALAAQRWLTDRGIDAGRITVRSMGEEQPVNSASNEQAWAQNRRDEFTITAGGERLQLPQGM